MKTISVMLCVSVLLLAACADPPCGPGERKVASTCYPIRTQADSSAATSMGDSGEQHDGAAFGADEALRDASADGALRDASVDPGSHLSSPTASLEAGAATSLEAGVGISSASAPECDSTHSCSPGFVCNADTCVSACTQTVCDPNASCSLVSNLPTCACNTGFTASSGSGANTTCVRDITCEQLNCATNAICKTDSQSHSCVCNPGYTGDGMSCAPVSCGQPSIANGTATVSGTTTYGNTVAYACNPGYVRDGVATASCGTDGKWSATAICTPVDCGDPGTPNEGTVATSNGNKFMSVATFSCLKGTLQGDRTRECQFDGRWSADIPTCSYCGDGTKSETEECDPTDARFSAWTCTSSCKKTTAYTACPIGISNACNAGENCASGFGFCTQTCTESSTCPAISTPRCYVSSMAGAGGVCVATCRTEADCAPGLQCLGSGATSMCFDCVKAQLTCH
jgi:hypothetical protein